MSVNENNRPDPLDALLREPDTYLADDGFTARVLAALPRRRRRAWLRPALLGLALFIGSGIAMVCVPDPIATLRAAVAGLSHYNLKSALMLLPILAALAPIYWGGFEMLREEN